jgi:hypothetical protein
MISICSRRVVQNHVRYVYAQTKRSVECSCCLPLSHSRLGPNEWDYSLSSLYQKGTLGISKNKAPQPAYSKTTSAPLPGGGVCTTCNTYFESVNTNHHMNRHAAFDLTLTKGSGKLLEQYCFPPRKMERLLCPLDNACAFDRAYRHDLVKHARDVHGRPGCAWAGVLV